MMENIISLLSIAKGETENIRIAQGVNKMPETLKEGFIKIKTELKWLRKR